MLRSFVRTDQSDRSFRKCNASVLSAPKRELFLVKLPYSSWNWFGHEQGSVPRKPRNFSGASPVTWFSICIFKTKGSRGTKLCSCVNFYSRLYNIWKDVFNVRKTKDIKGILAPEIGSKSLGTFIRETGPSVLTNFKPLLCLRSLISWLTLRTSAR